MVKNMAKTTEGWLEQAERRSREIKNPGSYEGPLPTPAPALPRNLLLFCRRRADMLSGERHRKAPPHQHHRFVLICALRGAGRVWVDSEGFSLGAGRAILISPHQKHSYSEIAPAKICWLFVTFEHPKDERLERLRSRAPVSLDEEASRALVDLLNAWGRDGEAAILYTAALLRRLTAAPLPRRRRDARGPTDELLGRINRFAFRHRSAAASIGELAAELGMSPSHLRAKFRKTTGQSLGSHLRDFRLQYACSLLRETDKRIGEVAEESGYDSPFTFSRAFSTAMGRSPRTYRAEGA